MYTWTNEPWELKINPYDIGTVRVKPDYTDLRKKIDELPNTPIYKLIKEEMLKLIEGCEEDEKIC